MYIQMQYMYGTAGGRGLGSYVGERCNSRADSLLKSSKKSGLSTDMPTHGFTDGNGDPIRMEEGEIDWGAGEELLSAEMKVEAFRIFAAPKFADK